MKIARPLRIDDPLIDGQDMRFALHRSGNSPLEIRFFRDFIGKVAEA
jgi:hypothetical protein